ncbi:MAG: hypothetical protein L6Q98_05330 [Anaerolineae bacterium]|nr:hypothetical protein [Anaerolineae bacterium]NUQ03642.1 hypothetical protein [Anaerolineae bacterium]
MTAFMIIVCVLVLLQISYFLVILTGELTFWLKDRLGEAYRKSKKQQEAVPFTATVMPKA